MATERFPLHGWQIGGNTRTRRRQAFTAQMFRDLYGNESIARSEFFGALGAGEILGVASITEDSDALSAQGALTLSAAAAIAEADDGIAAAAALSLAGTATVAEQDDATASSAQLALAAALAAAENDDALTASGALALSATAEISEAGDTPAANAALAVAAYLGGAQEDDDQLAAAAALSGGAQPPAIDGPWRLISADYQKPRQRPSARVLPFPPPPAPMPPRAPAPAARLEGLRIRMDPESPLRDQFLGEMAAPDRPDDAEVRRRREEWLALALLLAA